jgi:serine O-acetyltransferase
MVTVYKEALGAVLKSDIQRHAGIECSTVTDLVKGVFLNECVFYVVFYRICQRIINIKYKWLRFILKIPTVYTLFKFITLFFGIDINLKAEIGNGFYIGHFGGINIGPVKIGICCNISQGVTIGQGVGGKDSGKVPEIGDYVYFGPNSIVYGNIKIGNHVSIGANSVVSKDIPDHSIVVGNPGRIVGQQQVNLSILNIP